MTIVNNTIVAYLKVAKKLDLKSSHHKKKNCMVVNVHQTYGVNHYIMHFTNIKSLICVPETNTMFCVNCTSMKKGFIIEIHSHSFRGHKVLQSVFYKVENQGSH